MTRYRKQLGKTGELVAQAYLSKQNHSIRVCNYHTRFGELDIISEHDNMLVITEVKTYHTSWIDPVLVITPKKYKTMQAVTQLYCSESDIAMQVRFDLIIVQHDVVMRHIQNIQV